MVILLCLIGLLYQQHSIADLETRINNYRQFIMLHAYKQDQLPVKCRKCKHMNMVPLYSDTSIFKYSHQIKAIRSTLYP